jgi:hypothetical protein
VEDIVDEQGDGDGQGEKAAKFTSPAPVIDIHNQRSERQWRRPSRASA